MSCSFDQISLLFHNTNGPYTHIHKQTDTHTPTNKNTYTHGRGRQGRSEGSPDGRREPQCPHTLTCHMLSHLYHHGTAPNPRDTHTLMYTHTCIPCTQSLLYETYIFRNTLCQCVHCSQGKVMMINNQLVLYCVSLQRRVIAGNPWASQYSKNVVLHIPHCKTCINSLSLSCVWMVCSGS